MNVVRKLLHAVADRLRGGHEPPEMFWRSLGYFCIYRLLVAALFLGAIQYFGPTANFGHRDPQAFMRVCAFYLLLSLGFLALRHYFRRGFNWQLTAQVVTDIVILTLLMHYSGGAYSGMGFMLLVVLAGASLVGQGRLSLFFAALASCAVLLEQLLRVLRYDADPADFVHSGFIGIAFFALAISAHLLARRVVANETLARQRGQALAEQIRISERIIHDMQVGVVVVDAHAQVQHYNPRAAELLEVQPAQLSAHPSLLGLAPRLAESYARWVLEGVEASETMETTQAARSLQARFLPAGPGGNAVIYLEDLARLQAQAQQLKLAALGRLTVNMAHEIRNPLAAISHAAELLADEQRDTTRQRLTRIIGDNSQRLNRLVAEVLELGRRDRARAEWLNASQFVHAFIEEYALHEPRLKLQLHCQCDDDVMIWFDPAHLHRVLWNLLSNALRHASGAAGSVRLELRAASQLALHGTLNGSRGTAPHCEIHVSDDGPGIAAQDQAQIFEPFFTTHSLGTGLGLYIARELCEASTANLNYCGNAPGAHFCVTARSR